MQDAFQKVEEEFFRLRGLFSVGRITAQEYDEALRHLQVHDAEGRVWMLGANSGRWYYTNSPQWVKGDPTHDPDAAAEQVIFSDRPDILQTDANHLLPESQPSPQTEEQEPEASGSARRLALGFFGIGLAFLLVAFGLFILLAPDNNLFSGARTEPTPTRIVPRVAADLTQNSDAGLPSIAATHTPTRAGANFGTPVPVTATPGLVIEPTSTEPALTVIPSITPDANPNSDAALEPRAALPPAVYVTNIRVAPNPPGRGNQVTFTASFYNTNRASVGMNWRIILMDPNRQGNNKDYGESPFAGITVPPGRTDFSITFVPVSGDGPCQTLQVAAARRHDDNSRDYLAATTGGRFTTAFTFC